MKKNYSPIIVLIYLFVHCEVKAHQKGKFEIMEISENKFWEIIEQSKSSSFNQYSNNLTAILSTLPESDIYDFEVTLRKKIRELHNWNTFSICSLIEIVFSDEDFLDFKCWIIAQGKDFYYTFLENPELLADIIIREVQKSVLLRFERFLYVSDGAFELKYKGVNRSYLSPRDFADNINETYGDSDNLKGFIINSEEILKIKLPKIYKGVKDFLHGVDNKD